VLGRKLAWQLPPIRVVQRVPLILLEHRELGAVNRQYFLGSDAA
jgi:hypothetical protein